MKQWFRPPSRHRFGAARRPSGDEMREELESHVAMRAEHDGVDQAAARRRLGNTRTRALQSQLYNVPALDPWSWAAALVSLALVLRPRCSGRRVMPRTSIQLPH